jgi:hypothetical protein
VRILRWTQGYFDVTRLNALGLAPRAGRPARYRSLSGQIDESMSGPACLATGREQMQKQEAQIPYRRPYQVGDAAEMLANLEFDMHKSSESGRLARQAVPNRFFVVPDSS